MTDIRRSFDKDLSNLKQSMLEMFNHVINAYQDMFIMLETNDKKKADHLVEGDRLINLQEQRINEEAFLIILKQSPVAGDLRRIMTAIKIAHDLERIADYAVNVGTYVKKTNHDNSGYRIRFLEYGKPLLDMITKIRLSYENADVESAFRVCDMDNVIDDLYQKDIKEFIRVAKIKTDDEAEEASRALLIIKQFERTGDHITNIAEHIVFLLSGKQLELN